MQLIIELPGRDELMRRNRDRWQVILRDDNLAKLPYRIETNAHGQVIMNPPPSGRHSYRQGEIAFQIRSLIGGNTLPECPISTLDGVKAVDVGWYSDKTYDEVSGQDVFERAPEICVEVISLSNSASEMRQKKSLYFEAGAQEVWFCHQDGHLEFFESTSPDVAMQQSIICREFPDSIE